MNGDLLIGDVFRNAARAVPDRMAVALGPATLTFAQLDRQANRLARALHRIGVKRGDRVATWRALAAVHAPGVLKDTGG